MAVNFLDDVLDVVLDDEGGLLVVRHFCVVVCVNVDVHPGH